MRKIYTAAIILLISMTSMAETLSTGFISFEVSGQVSSTIDTTTHAIQVIMPEGSSLDALVPSFALSSGATAFIGEEEQVSGTSVVDFSEGEVTYTVKNGDDSQDWVVSAIIESAIAEKATIEVNVYPNPATNYVVIENVEFATVSIYNIIGSLVTTINSTQNELNVDLTNFRKGTYLITIQKGNQLVTKKVSVIN